MTTKVQWIEEEIEGLKQNGLFNRIRTLSSPQGAWLVVDGKRVLNFCSNNYLGLANHSRMVQAVQEAVSKYGVGPAAVRSIAGTMDLHLELERAWRPLKEWRLLLHSNLDLLPIWRRSPPWSARKT